MTVMIKPNVINTPSKIIRLSKFWFSLNKSNIIIVQTFSPKINKTCTKDNSGHKNIK